MVARQSKVLFLKPTFPKIRYFMIPISAKQNWEKTVQRRYPVQLNGQIEMKGLYMHSTEDNTNESDILNNEQQNEPCNAQKLNDS